MEKGTCPGSERESSQPEITNNRDIWNSFVKLHRLVAQTPLLFRFRAMGFPRRGTSLRARHIGTSAHRHIGTNLATRSAARQAPSAILCRIANGVAPSHPATRTRTSLRTMSADGRRNRRTIRAVGESSRLPQCALPEVRFPPSLAPPSRR